MVTGSRCIKVKERKLKPFCLKTKGGGGAMDQEKRVFLFGLSLILVILMCMVGVGQVQSQEKYPTKPIEIIVPFSPGAAQDLVSRLAGAFL